MLERTAGYRAERARQLDAVGRQWHRARAAGLRSKVERRRECGTWTAVAAHCRYKTRTVFPRLCADRVTCERCAAVARKRVTARLIASIERERAAATAAWARGRRRPLARPRLAMLTLTTRHSGDLTRDRDTLQRAWARHRAWIRKHFARLHGESYARLKFWRTWECAPGSDGSGHVHCHVVLVAPFWDWAAARLAWERHTDGEASQYDVRARATSPRAAARYVAKYVGKGSGGLEVDTAARWWAASYGRRAVSAHRGAWVERPVWTCPCCDEPPMRWVRLVARWADVPWTHAPPDA